MTRYLLFTFLIVSSLNSKSQKAVVSLPAMNVIYIGLENPIDVAVEGYNNSQLSISTSGCELIGSPAERMYLRASEPGKCIVSVNYNKDGVGQKQEFSFRVKSIPKPEVCFGALEEGNYPAAALLGQNVIGANIPGFVFMAVKYNVVSYKWKFYSPSRLFSCTQTELGSGISAKLKSLIVNGRIGDEIILDSVKCSYVGGVKSILSPVSFRIESEPHDFIYDFMTHQDNFKSKKSYYPYSSIFDCNWNPINSSGIFNFYKIVKNDTQSVLEVGLSASKIIFEKRFFSSGVISQEYNFNSTDSLGDASIYYENGQLKSKGKVIQNRSNINFSNNSFYLGEKSNLIFSLIYPQYPPVGIWKGYYKEGGLALECKIELNDPSISVLDTFQLKDKNFNTEVIKYKLYDQLHRVIEFRD